MKNNILKTLIVFSTIGGMLSFSSCSSKKKTNSVSEVNSQESIQSSTNSNATSKEDKISELLAKHQAITVTKAVEIANGAGSTETTNEYVCVGKIETVSNPQYGEMTISDGTSSIYVFGVVDYSTMESKPIAGDIIVIKGKLKVYKDKAEFSKSTMIEFYHEEKKADDSYISSTVANARSAAKDSKLSLEGIVAKITYANGMVPNGFFLVDSTGSIYIYGNDAAGQVAIGNKIKVEGTKDYYIAENEKNNANQYGYQGCIQLTNANVITNDKGNHEFPKDSIAQTTIKKVMETSLKTNITTNIYKVNALIKKDKKEGFTNYYLDDLDGKTGSYCYTACNGSDYSWLDEFDGKVCEVYFSPINCKSTSSGCVYRFVPIQVRYRDFAFDESKACEFAIEYFAKGQFDKRYEGDPCLEVITTASIDVVNISGIEVSYESSNTDVAYFASEDDKLIFHTKNIGNATITINTKYGEYTASETVAIKVIDPNEIESINVKEAIESAKDEEVIVKGIVGPSLVNKVGFYLMDETGTINVITNAEAMSTLKMGDEVILKGTKDEYGGSETVYGTNVINNATIEVNMHGDKKLPFANVVTDKTPAEIYALPAKEDHTTTLFKVTGKLEFTSTDKYSSVALVCGETKFSLYTASASQYNFLSEYNGVEGEFVIALCNYNKKNFYKVNILSATYGDTTIYNQLNFKK